MCIRLPCEVNRNMPSQTEDMVVNTDHYDAIVRRGNVLCGSQNGKMIVLIDFNQDEVKAKSALAVICSDIKTDKKYLDLS